MRQMHWCHREMPTVNYGRSFLQALRDGLDDVAEPAMGRVAVEPAMPEHHRANAGRVVGRRADLQRMVPHELLRDPAAQCCYQIGLRKD